MKLRDACEHGRWEAHSVRGRGEWLGIVEDTK